MTDATKMVETVRESNPPSKQLDDLINPTVNVLDTSTSLPSLAETVSPTASVTTSEDAASKRPSSAASDMKESAQTAASAANQVYILTQLARQLEYYLSSQNLSKDTYVQTLRSLNDGCVPVSILANFSKVKMLLSGVVDEEERVQAVLQASTEYSDGLRVLSIDTGSGKIVTDETPSGANTILAIGTHDNQPLQAVTTVTSALTLSPETPVLPSSPGSSTNTLILRDVVQEATEDDIRELFNFEGCPLVESIHQDVANCW